MVARPALPGTLLARKSTAGPLAATAVHDILERRIALSGLPLPLLGSHALRHSFAVHLLRLGVSLPAIGGVGHRDGESTAIYLRLAVMICEKWAYPCPRAGTRRCWSGATGSSDWFRPGIRPAHARFAGDSRAGWQSLCGTTSQCAARWDATSGEKRSRSIVGTPSCGADTGRLAK